MVMVATSKLRLGTFVSFAAVGGLATLLHWLIAAALVGWAAWPPVLASTVGFCCSAVLNFLANARLTFGVASVQWSQALRFFAVATMGVAINAWVLALLIKASLPLALAQVGATVCVLLWNFLLNSLWVFGASRRTR